MPFDAAPAQAATTALYDPHATGLAGQLARVRAGAEALRADADSYGAQLDRLLGSDFVALMRRIAASPRG